MGLIPTLSMSCAMQNGLAEEELSSLANWIRLGSLDHLEVCWVGSAYGLGRCDKCM